MTNSLIQLDGFLGVFSSLKPENLKSCLLNSARAPAIPDACQGYAGPYIT